jgi:hypothetical protein
MPGYTHGMSDAAALIQPLLLRLRNPGRSEADRDRRRTLASKALLLLTMPRDGKSEWIAAGEALQRVLLRATSAGLYASYLNQPIEVEDLRSRLRQVIGEPGQPQVMLRLGYGLDVRPTPRRAVDTVLRRLEARSRRTAALAIRTAPLVPRTPELPSAHVH